MIKFSEFLFESSLFVPAREDTLGIDRKDMPQIAEKDYNHFFNHLTKSGINHSVNTIAPSKLKATQGQFHKEKIKNIIDSINDNTYKPKPILTSKDNYIMDGHHRWLAHSNLNVPIKIYKIDLKSDDLINVLNNYPKSFKEKLYQ